MGVVVVGVRAAVDVSVMADFGSGGGTERRRGASGGTEPTFGRSVWRWVGPVPATVDFVAIPRVPVPVPGRGGGASFAAAAIA